MTSYDGISTARDDVAPPRPEPRDPMRLDLRARRTASVLLAVIILVIAVIVFWPGPPDPSGQNALEHFLYMAHANGLPRRITFNLVQNLANVAMFLPLGLLGSLALRRRNFLVVLYGALASGLIELTQLVLLPDRVASMEDVLSNTAGALIGFLISIPALRRRLRRRRRYLQGRRGAADSPRRAARMTQI
jgi:VanZ family protein